MAEVSAPATPASASVSIKFVYGEEVRRVSLARDVSWSDFVEAIQSVFGLSVSRLSLQYRDTDGDLVTVTSEPELAELVAQAATGSAAQRVIVTAITADAEAQEKSGEWEVVSDGAASTDDAAATTTRSSIEAVDDVSDKPAAADEADAQDKSDAPKDESPKSDAAAQDASSTKRKRSPFVTLFESLRAELDAFAQAVFDESRAEDAKEQAARTASETAASQEANDEEDSDNDEDDEEEDEELAWVRRAILARARMYEHYRIRALLAERERRRRLALAQSYYYGAPTRYYVAAPSCRAGYCW